MNQKALQAHHEKVSLQNQTLQREEAKQEKGVALISHPVCSFPVFRAELTLSCPECFVCIPVFFSCVGFSVLSFTT